MDKSAPKSAMIDAIASIERAIEIGLHAFAHLFFGDFLDLGNGRHDPHAVGCLVGHAHDWHSLIFELPETELALGSGSSLRMS